MVLYLLNIKRLSPLLTTQCLESILHYARVEMCYAVETLFLPLTGEELLYPSSTHLSSPFLTKVKV